ncbi:MAG: tetratricopeptide repeat protein [Bryobacteraceae bacterium]
MRRGSTSRRQDKFKILALLIAVATVLRADQRCVACHPKEVAGYAATGMARSLAPIGSAAPVPDGNFEHAFSQTKFSIHADGTTVRQSLERKDESIEQIVSFVVGSGNHAFGYLTLSGDHLFQSPLAYYTARKIWDVAPGYEYDPHPDFSRPVSTECLFCHSGKSLPIADSLNRYQPGVFAAYGITCERCHGDTAAHLKNPVAGSILNPKTLSGAARASVCEQCHLTGEARIPNPGKSITGFKPGHTLEEFYTTYVAAQSSGQSIKVVSHAEQLALSQCARKSGDRLWCGTCHNPHEKPAQPVAYFRDRCLSCHAATLPATHGAPTRDCIGCHMPKLPASDGGHTAFTNHRILRDPKLTFDDVVPDTLTAWRAPDPGLANRNLALALVSVGLQNGSSAEVIRGYRMMNRIEKDFSNDPSLLTTLGLVLMKGKQPAEALKRFEKVIALKPDYAPYYVNAATAMLSLNQPSEAAQQLEKALSLDSLLQPAVQLLGQIYREQGQDDKAKTLQAKYDRAMGITH